MFKLLKKIKFDEKENRMSNVGAIEEVIENFSKNKNKKSLINLMRLFD